MVKSIKIFQFIFFILTAFSCNPENDKEEAVVNDCFLDIVGTQGYMGVSLVPPPPTLNDKKIDKPNLWVEVDTSLQTLNKWKESINIFFKENPDFSTYKNFLNEYFSKNESPENIELKAITRTGRYKIINASEKKKSVLGKVSFSKIVFNKEKDQAAFVVTIFAGPKAGNEKLFLAKLISGVWKIQYEELFIIY
jgi:hypothetical protein